MKKQEIALLVLLIIFTIAIRLSALNIGNFINYDDFYHLSIVKQAIAGHSLPDSTSLDLCYFDNFIASQPWGFYLAPFLLSSLGINIETAFMITSLLAACLTIVLFYFLLKKIFNFKTAIISAFILSATFSYFSRSNIFYYRGENLIYPLLLAGLILCISMFKSESKIKFLYAALAGAVSALAAFIWIGYPFAIVSIFLAVFLPIAVNFIEMKTLKKDICAIGILLIVQLIFLQIIFSLTHLEHAFTKYSLYIYPALLLVLGLFYLGGKIKSGKGRLVSLAVFAFISLAFLMLSPFTKSMMQGFGMIIPQTPFYSIIIELQPITLAFIWKTIWLTFALAIPGIFLFALSLKRPLETEKIIFIAMLLPALYLLTTTNRFVFLASIPLAALAGIFLARITDLTDKKPIKFILIAIPVIIILLSAFHTYSMSKTIASPAKDYILSSLDYFKENTQEHSCLVVIQDWGGLVEYYAERPTYQSSVTQPADRINNYLLFLLGEKSAETFDMENAYLGVFLDDFPRIRAMVIATESEKKGYGYEFLFQSDIKETSNLTTVKYNKNTYEIIYPKTRDSNVSAFRKGNRIKTVFIENNNKVSIITDESASDTGCVYLSGSLTSYFNEKMCGSNMVKMYSQQSIEGAELWYSASGVRIYRVVGS